MSPLSRRQEHTISVSGHQKTVVHRARCLSRFLLTAHLWLGNLDQLARKITYT